jgi:hypothetical protein
MAIFKDDTSQDLTSAALSFTKSYGDKAVKICSVEFKASTAITETITISKDSGSGANYDVTLDSKSLSAETSYVFRPTGEEWLVPGDAIKVACTKANTTGTIYCSILTSDNR